MSPRLSMVSFLLVVHVAHTPWCSTDNDVVVSGSCVMLWCVMSPRLSMVSFLLAVHVAHTSWCSTDNDVVVSGSCVMLWCVMSPRLSMVSFLLAVHVSHTPWCSTDNDVVVSGSCVMLCDVVVVVDPTSPTSRVQHPNHVAANSLSPQVARKGSTLSGFVQRSRLEREVGRDLHSNKWDEV